MGKQLFRKDALEKLSTPEQLNKMLIIIPPSAWIAILGGIIIIIAALLWAVFGVIPETVSANGIFVPDQNAYVLSSEVTGIVETIEVKVGDVVEEGDVLYTLNTKSLEDEKSEIEKRKKIVEAIEIDSSGDISNSDTQGLLEIKRQISNAGTTVSNYELTLQIKEAELEKITPKVEEARHKMNAAKQDYENYQLDNETMVNNYDKIISAWNSVTNYKTAMDASSSLVEAAREEFEYYEYFEDSGDPEEKQDFENAKNNYASAENTYFSNKSQYETAMYLYNDLLLKSYPDAQPNTAPGSQVPPLETYMRAYKEKLSELQTIYNDRTTDYNNAYQKKSSIENEIEGLKINIATGENGEGATVTSLKNQFEATKESLINGFDADIAKYEKNIEKNAVTTSIGGIISDIKVSVGAAVSAGSSTVTIRKKIDDGEQVILYVPIASGKKLEPGMKVKVYPTTVSKQEYGNMSGEIVSVDDYVTSVNAIKDTLGDESLANTFSSSGPVVAVRCNLERDENSLNGFKWTNDKGNTLRLQSGTLVSADIITGEKKPIEMIVPYIEEKFDNSVDINKKKSE